jgi:hypothetical protein
MFSRSRGRRPRSCKIGNLLNGIVTAMGRRRHQWHEHETWNHAPKPGFDKSSSDTSAYDCRCPQPF